MPSYEQVAQTSHFFIATTLLLVTARYSRRVGVGIVVLLGWGLCKEFVFDILVEADSWSGSVIDFFWYMLGGLVGVLYLDVDEWLHQGSHLKT